MTYHPPPNDLSPQESTFDANEQPATPPAARRNHAPDETRSAEQQPSTPPQPGTADTAHAGYPVQHQQTIEAYPFWGELPLLGQVAGAVGLLLLIFFFLPWCFTPDVSAASTPITNHFPTTSHSGWATATGAPLLGGSTSFNLFPQLWLILISALALIVIGVLVGGHRINLRLAALLIIIVSLYALLLEILFLVQITSFQNAIDNLAGGRLNQTLYGVSWGFWLGLAATVVALGIGAYLLYQEYLPEAGQRPHAPHFPRGQQPHATA